MSRRATLRLTLLAIVALGGVFGPATERASAAPTIVYDCSPAPVDCGGWFRSNVSLDWTVLPSNSSQTGCNDVTLTADSKAAYEYCTARASDGSRSTVELWLKIDKTPPTVIAPAFSRPSDGNGWFRAPVAITFRASDATSGILACTRTSYAGPSTAAARVSGRCRDRAGNFSATRTFGFKYDANPPKVLRGRPVRRPDHKGWYNHPVAWHFRGRDRLSGLAGCPKIVYRGPDGRHAHVVGACADKAGNIGVRAMRLRYDNTPPRAPHVRAFTSDRAVRLRIRVSHAAKRMSIVRARGRRGTRGPTIYRGRPRSSFTDLHVLNGRRYRYTVTVRDRAANRSHTMVRARPDARLLSPGRRAVLTAPPLLRWTAIRGASYYNVQLVRNGKKVLSRWPDRARLRLHKDWRFAGQVRRLVPGHYRWTVWPGFGPRSLAHYGQRVGSRTFVIPARSPAR